MSVEENKEIARRWMQALNTRELDAFDEIIAADGVIHFAPSLKLVLHGPEEYRQALGVYLAAFPDCHFTTNDIVAEGDKVVVHWTFSGTHTADFIGIAPTGKKITNPGVTLMSFANGQAVEARAIWDDLNTYRELGVDPPQPSSG